jgi:hypothetical protein
VASALLPAMSCDRDEPSQRVAVAALLRRCPVALPFQRGALWPLWPAADDKLLCLQFAAHVGVSFFW